MPVDSGSRRRAPDRCPFPRPFEDGFDACPGYQAVKFTAFDSNEVKLGTWSTCRHLAGVEDPQQRGHFYPRCWLGTAEDRVRWVARVTSARLEVVRALQEEFDRVTEPHWKLLLEAKRDHLTSPSKAESHDTLDRLLASLHEAIRGFLYRRKQQFDSVGLQAEAVMTLVEATSRSWARNPQLAFKDQNPAALRALAPEFQAFLAEPLLTPWRQAEADATELYEDAILRIAETGPHGLRFMGTIDASNSEAVSRTLKSRAAGGAEYHLDFGGLVFCDVAGLRMIVEAGQNLSDPSKLYLDNLPRHLARVAKLAGWADNARVVLVPVEAVPA